MKYFVYSNAGDIEKHDSFENFRSENLNLFIGLHVLPEKSSESEDEVAQAEILFYRWL